MDLLCFFSVLCLLCLCARLLICALWSPAGKGLTSWLSFVVSNCMLVTFPLVSWVRSGTKLNRFLIFAPLLTSKRYPFKNIFQMAKMSAQYTQLNTISCVFFQKIKLNTNVSSGQSKRSFKTDYRSMQVKSFAERGPFCNTFDLH